jgi:hypothetical protein
MSKRLFALPAALAVVLAAAPVACAGGSAARSGCPTGQLALGSNAIGPAAAAALDSDATRNRPQLTGAMLAPSDVARGGQVKAQCGKTVWRRTVVVYVLDRAFLPSASLSQRVLFVGRTGRGYEVWERAR